MGCGTLKNAELGEKCTTGAISGVMFSAKKLDALNVSTAFESASTIQALMQAGIDNGRLLKLFAADKKEIGASEVVEAESDLGNYPIDTKPPTHKLQFYTSECGMKSVMSAFGDGVEGYGYLLTEKGYIQGKEDSDGDMLQISMNLYAKAIKQNDSIPDGVELSIAIRENYEANQISKKPSFELSELESIKEVKITNLVASDTLDTVVFDAKLCSGVAVTDVTLANYKVTAAGSTIVATGTAQTGSEVTLTFDAASVTGAVTVELDKPSTTSENYESDLYTTTAV